MARLMKHCTRCSPSAQPSGPKAKPVPNVQRECLSKRIAAGSMAFVASMMLTASPVLASVPQTSAPGSNVGYLSDDEVAARRQELHFTRAFDGKVALQTSNGSKFWDVKLDLKSPGTLLLRSPEGVVHYIAFDSLTQIDLSDDEVVGAIAASGWEQGAQAVQAEDGRQVVKLEMTREGFYELMSVVDPSLAPAPSQ